MIIHRLDEILLDSHDALQTRHAVKFHFEVVLPLRQLAERHSITLRWASSNSDIIGNELAGGLFSEGSFPERRKDEN